MPCICVEKRMPSQGKANGASCAISDRVAARIGSTSYSRKHGRQAGQRLGERLAQHVLGPQRLGIENGRFEKAGSQVDADQCHAVRTRND